MVILSLELKDITKREMPFYSFLRSLVNKHILEGLIFLGHMHFKPPKQGSLSELVIRSFLWLFIWLADNLKCLPRDTEMFMPNVICIPVLSHVLKPELWPNLSTHATAYFTLWLMKLLLHFSSPGSKCKQFTTLQVLCWNRFRWVQTKHLKTLIIKRTM